MGLCEQLNGLSGRAREQGDGERKGRKDGGKTAEENTFAETTVSLYFQIKCVTGFFLLLQVTLLLRSMLSCKIITVFESVVCLRHV